MKNMWKKVAALTGAAVLSFALFGTAAADPVWATVTGHMASTSDNNEASWWEDFGEGYDECTSLNAGEGDLGAEVDTYLLAESYELVVVKAGSTNQGDPNTLTLFANASAGETVWADYFPDGVFGEGDKNISHIIFCDPSQEESEPPSEAPSEVPSEVPSEPPSEAPSFTSTEEPATDLPSEPNTATIGGTGTSAPSDSSWLLVAALGVLLASVVVLTPARAKTRR